MGITGIPVISARSEKLWGLSQSLADKINK
jgi:hypothetical protein